MPQTACLYSAPGYSCEGRVARIGLKFADEILTGLSRGSSAHPIDGAGSSSVMARLGR